eukprot:GHVT01049380.1.p1 GENE.GHVT01049380.1~~GHVT01049380.1.p1  ORF type:complete len:119 (+),score=26.14 GHVT01049380.1:852-1208(+)
MVFYFECSDPAYKIYMGKDKYENEDLIAYGFPEDIWFHACDLSSAHVYLRMPVGTELAQVPKNVMKEMAQLTKANSIEGERRRPREVETRRKAAEGEDEEKKRLREEDEEEKGNRRTK